MSTVQAVVSIFGGLLLLAGLAFAAWQLLKRADMEATIKRLRESNADYLQRLNYIEPKHRALEQQVDYLLALHDPTAKLDALADQNTEQLRILHAVKRLCEQVDRSLYAPREQPNDRTDRSG